MLRSTMPHQQQVQQPPDLLAMLKALNPCNGEAMSVVLICLMQSDLNAAYLAALRESRTFNCPDCIDAMAEAYGVTAAVNQLRVCCNND